MLARLDIEGFRSIRDLSLALRPLNVLVCPEGPGTSDLVAALSCLREILDGRFQHHVLQQGGPPALLTWNGEQAPELRWGLEFQPGDFSYSATFTRSDGGLLSLVHEEFGVLSGSMVAELVNRALPASARFESTLPTLVTVEPRWETFPESSDAEGRWLGFAFARCVWELRTFMGGLQRIVPGQEETAPSAPLLVLDVPEADLPPNALWNLARLAREAAKTSQVFLCTRCTTLANEFGHEDVIAVDMHENASRFQRLPPGELGAWLACAGRPA